MMILLWWCHISNISFKQFFSILFHLHHFEDMAIWGSSIIQGQGHEQRHRQCQTSRSCMKHIIQTIKLDLTCINWTSHFEHSVILKYDSKNSRSRSQAKVEAMYEMYFQKYQWNTIHRWLSAGMWYVMVIPQSFYKHRSRCLCNSWGWDRMAEIRETTFSNSFLSMKFVIFGFKFGGICFQIVHYMIGQHWFRYWLGSKEETSHYLNQFFRLHIPALL